MIRGGRIRLDRGVSLGKDLIMRWLTVTLLAVSMASMLSLSGCKPDKGPDDSGSGTKQPDGSDSKPAPQQEQQPSGSGSR